ncbi:Reverse transcriptase RNA-dependent DNA polymerase [Arabidopsis thaliana x Arabidopsis arenosa]|uniref:Reverse transcriptase RNA-dependent DNA polymerase n=1 Tax=Arabidopsis thaliana x Arabidopsis arenosa TaxID=1240361 RepID=A0A8T2A578_9BRAS|nr:Reverse transcriptase RNA-dependent DNA polymerase [Arabidopsis thaliana x Arabidopsis arenosa]
MAPMTKKRKKIGGVPNEEVMDDGERGLELNPMVEEEVVEKVRTSMYQSYGGRRCLMSLPKQFWSRDLSVVANSSSSTSTALGIQSSSSAPPQENKRGSKWSQLLLFLPGAITFSLGSWQIVRREEKFKTLKGNYMKLSALKQRIVLSAFDSSPLAALTMLFEVQMHMPSTKMHAAVKKVFIGKYQRFLKLGEWKIIDGFSLSPYSGKYKISGLSYKMGFINNTEVHKCDFVDDSIFLDLKDFEDVKSDKFDENVLIDIFGQVVSLGKVENLITQHKQNKKLEFQLRDASDERLSCTLWGVFADKVFDGCKNAKDDEKTVVLIRYAKINNYKGDISITYAFDASDVMVNPLQYPDVVDFVNSLPNDGLALSIQDRNMNRDIVLAKKDNFLDHPSRTIAELIASTEVGKWRIIGTVFAIDTDWGWFYFGCAKCNRKEKYEVFSKFLEFKVTVVGELGQKIKTLRMDNGGEFMSAYTSAKWSRREEDQTSKKKEESILLYVDDMIVTGNDDAEIARLQEDMSIRFEMKKLELNKFLGLEFKRLRCDEGSLLPDPRPYRALVGILLYLTITRPDIAFAVGLVSRFMQAPRKPHLEAAKKILKYVKTTLDMGLVYKYNAKIFLHGFIDADFGGDLDDQKSTSGYVFLCGDTKCIWLRRLFEDLLEPINKPVAIYGDNQSAIKLANNPVFHARTKHIELEHHFIREKVLDGTIEALEVRSEDNVVDIFTKSLPKGQFELLRSKGGMVDKIKFKGEY